MSRRTDADGAPPRATIDVLRLRADLLTRTRHFFAARGVLEVETALLARGLVVDAHIDPITCAVGPPGRAEPRFLLPSPEAPMKRLLAAGSGPIFALSKAFRQGERGRLHRPEFTMLEWYRPGLTYRDLMDEVGDLLRDLLGIDSWMKRTVCEVFADVLGVDPHTATADELAATARDRGVAFSGGSGETSRADWLDLLFAACVQPHLDPATPTFVHDFPTDQCALASVRPGTPPVAERFELLYRGMELANGYQELTDAQEHRRRFDAANAQRSAVGKPTVPPDELLVEAVERGLPICSGVALGFDRVAMIAAGTDRIADVLPLDD